MMSSPSRLYWHSARYRRFRHWFDLFFRRVRPTLDVIVGTVLAPGVLLLWWYTAPTWHEIAGGAAAIWRALTGG